MIVAPRMMDTNPVFASGRSNPYGNRLRELLDNPESIAQTPGYKFMLDQGLQGVNRSNSAQRGSGNVLAALMKYGSGLAATERGNEIDRLGRLEGQAGQYDLGAEANRLTGVRDSNNYSLNSTRNANDLALGTRSADTADKRVDYDYSIAGRNSDNTRNANDQQFGLGMYRAGNDFTLGSEQNANTAQNNWWNHQSNSEQNANSAAANANAYSIANGRNDIDWFNAGTNRGQAQSQDWWNPQRQARMPLTRRIA